MSNKCSHEWDTDNASCVFGCGRYIDPDTGYCPTCGDHSNNQVECLHCGAIANVDSYTGEIEDFDDLPTHEPIRASDKPVNSRMSTLKRAEDKINRYRNKGIL